jgi:hypothetical protein
MPAVRGRIMIGLVPVAVACAMGNAPPDPAHDLGAGGPPILERLRVDVDDDSTADELLVYAAPTDADPGRAGALEVRLGGADRHRLTGRWDAAPAKLPATASVGAAPIVQVGNFARAGHLVFLFGPSYGCCAQDLTIYRVSRAGFAPYYAAAEFTVDRLVPSSAEGEAMLEGRSGLTQPVSPPLGVDGEATAYLPVRVIRLGSEARLDSAASEQRTRAELGGFAGLEYRDDVLAVRRSDGTRFLWDVARRQPVP